MQPRCLRAVRVLARILWGADDRFRKIEYGKRFARDRAARSIASRPESISRPRTIPTRLPAQSTSW